MERKVELLAPAGNPEGFYGAIHAGADAVYLGGDRFNARAYADNFTAEELLACIRYAHMFNRRVWLTLNTLVKESEFDSLYPYLQPLYEAGLDGVIVQDLGVFALVRECFPDMELHASTQMTVTGRYGAELLRRAGATRVVPARELSLAEIRALKAGSDIQVEVFIHGAMCYSYSGQCLFSSILGGRSGNRGRCAQPCRLPYHVEAGQGRLGECYPLSLKDLCAIEHIPELIEAGIDSFKIEGRMKRAEYTAGVTAIYRKYIDRYYAGEWGEPDREDLETLARLYIRSERQDGYFEHRNGRDMISLQSPSYNSPDERLADAIRARYLDRRLSLPVAMRADFTVGEPARLTLTLDESGSLCFTAEGEVIQAAQKQPVTLENIQRQLSKLGDTPFCAKDLQVRLSENAFYPLKGMNDLRRRATDGMEELLIRENGFTLRKALKNDFTERVGADFRKHSEPAGGGEDCRPAASGCGAFHVLFRTWEQADAILNVMRESGRPAIGRVYAEADLILQAFGEPNGEFAAKFYEIHENGCGLAIALPRIIREQDAGFLTEIWDIYESHRELFDGFLVRSVDSIGFLKEKIHQTTGGQKGQDTRPKAAPDVPMYGDAGLYIWNRTALRRLQRGDREKCKAQEPYPTQGQVSDPLAVLSGFCMPYELKAADQRKLLGVSKIACEKVVYGRIPLMVTANCIFKTAGHCDRAGEDIGYLMDRYGKKFPVLKNCRHCMNIVYNSLPLSLHGELSKWRDMVDFRLDLTVEDGPETARILQYFISGARGELPYEEYTTGHEKRGAE
ncbi:MAG: U32 family peptidase [Clostridium sp.]|nr:U32 family peptidase [Acetatifactor muris]MCM1528262.1 U32 family peptidase [Bacteroides sp.]MCM1562285.1 U32 family peptidase [Clostridium sp.]